MENARKGFEIFDEKISPDNIVRMGELLAAYALKLVCQYKGLYKMRADLARDIDYKDLEGYTFTDSYDLVQEAAMFLCGYMGKSVYDSCIEPKSGKTYTIRGMCSKTLCHKLYVEWKIKRHTESMEDLPVSREPNAAFEPKEAADYTTYDAILERLDLTKGEKETIDCYMAGIGFSEQARLLSLNLSTIWRRRKSAQMKYLAIAETL